MEAYSRVLIVCGGVSQGATATILGAAGFRAITTCPPQDAASVLDDPRAFAVAVFESSAEQALALVAAIRRDRRFERLPLIVAPDGAAPVDIYEAFDAGATDVLRPPTPPASSCSGCAPTSAGRAACWACGGSTAAARSWISTPTTSWPDQGMGARSPTRQLRIPARQLALPFAH